MGGCTSQKKPVKESHLTAEDLIAEFEMLTKAKATQNSRMKTTVAQPRKNKKKSVFDNLAKFPPSEALARITSVHEVGTLNPWEKRFNVAGGTARGTSFHFGTSTSGHERSGRKSVRGSTGAPRAWR